MKEEIDGKTAVVGFLGISLGIVVVILLIVTQVLLNAVVFQKLWEWFIINRFHISPLSIKEAIGIGLIFAFLSPTESLKREEKTSKVISNIFISPITYFVIGYLIHIFL